MIKFVAVLGMAVLASALPTRSDPSDFIPFKKGTYWIYQGTVSRLGHTPDGKPVVNEQPVIWRSEVIGGPYVPNAWLLRGAPMDLVWSGNDVVPQDHLIFQVGTDYYDLTGMGGPTRDEAFEKLEADIVAPNFDLDAHADEIDRARIWCEFPLALGKRFGESGDKLVNSLRTVRYCWNVESVVDFDSSKIKGFPVIQHPRVYLVAFRTSPDDSEMEIVPGVGLVGYHYHHHGTTMQVDVTLIEYHAAP